jgi:hypothetical protein
MTDKTTIDRDAVALLARMNPIPHGMLASEVDVGPMDVELKRIFASPRRRRRSHKPLAIAAWALGAFVLAGTALGLNSARLLDFFSSKPAPPTITEEFASLGIGAPAGMDPQALPNETRKIEDGAFGGDSHTLWVAPTKGNGFCYVWTPGYGGCDATGRIATDLIGAKVPPAGASPITLPARTDPSYGSAVRAAIRSGVMGWVAGYSNEPSADAVGVVFSDGSQVNASAVRVSAPISALFYYYDISRANQTRDVHAVSVRVLDAGGQVIQERAVQP